MIGSERAFCPVRLRPGGKRFCDSHTCEKIISGARGAPFELFGGRVEAGRKCQSLSLADTVSGTRHLAIHCRDNYVAVNLRFF